MPSASIITTPEPHSGTVALSDGSAGRCALIEVRDLKLALGGESIFDSLSFSVAGGELLCILGPSGCGKSTLLRLLGDLIRPASGTITIGGRPPEETWSRLAYVFQSPRLVPWRTALRNVTLARELRYGGKVDRATLDRAVELLHMVGLERYAHRFPLMLSGGERQRIAIARALAVDPEIILMDEPLSALDIKTRQRLRQEILRIWQLTGKTIVFVTHDIDDAVMLADRVLMLSAKPTRVFETVVIDVARPRRIEAAGDLQAIRAKLQRWFTDIEAG